MKNKNKTKEKTKKVSPNKITVLVHYWSYIEWSKTTVYGLSTEDVLPTLVCF